MAEKTKREMAIERMRERHPDAEWADDEAVWGQAYDDYGAWSDEVSTYKEREGKFAELFTKDPRSAGFLMAWRDGDDPVVALVREFGSDIVGALGDPDRQEQIAEANKEYLERVAKNNELEEEYKKNLAESLENIDRVRDEQGYSEEDIDRAMALALKIADDAIRGIFTPETLGLALKAIDHDSDVARADAEGETRGRNAKIEERLRKPQGDGVSAIGGKNRRGEPEPDPTLGALGNMGGAGIWERGGARRIKR